MEPSPLSVIRTCITMLVEAAKNPITYQESVLTHHSAQGTAQRARPAFRHGECVDTAGEWCDRRSLGRKVYLTSVEKRMQSLETLIAQRLPDLDIEEALKLPDLHRSGEPSQAARSPSLSRSTISTPGTDEVLLSPGNTISEAVPDEADGFDWQEDANELADGMAALSVEPNGTGYLGSTAGVFFLRSLLFWLGNPGATVVDRDVSGVSHPRDFDQASSSSRLSQSLASHQVQAKLLDTYFSVYHVTYPFIHEATFRAQFHEIIPRPQQRSWQMLLNTVLALGAWCLNSETTYLDDDLYHQARAFGEDESMFESANITCVQALVLLSNLGQKRNKPNTGSNLLGLAVRMALSLGLHREFPSWGISLFQREMRRRVWWGLYLFDSGAATTFGRPILLPGREAMDVHHVLNVDDEFLTPRTDVLPGESSVPTIYSSMKTQCDFHVHSNHISNRLLSAAGVSMDEALSMNKALDSWAETVPPYFQLPEEVASEDHWYLFARSRLWWRFWNLKIIIFRQILLGRAIDQGRGVPSTTADTLDRKGRQAGVNAAQSTIESINLYLENGVGNRLVSWYSVYFLFHASLVVALAIRGDTESPELSKWHEDIGMVRNILRNVLAENTLAARCADILDHILPHHPQDFTFSDIGQIDFDTMDFSLWPVDQTDILSSLGWPDAGHGI
ncbi:Uu.00g143550.m01.CDS01 [Anthostomella pinea]|uniref:Uu.00g143550.m01.CDS01 n=1 Tax=Anthostomella pinea TaxID=933095 RepID=A0AAI8VRH6_9PEZI|nr:Uu.00g143550.m01.CDS01 [Anthostomella pinea]